MDFSVILSLSALVVPGLEPLKRLKALNDHPREVPQALIECYAKRSGASVTPTPMDRFWVRMP